LRGSDWKTTIDSSSSSSFKTFIERITPVVKVKVSFMLTEGSAGSNEERRRAPEHLTDETYQRLAPATSPIKKVVF
jgi:hypothetical protein